MQVRYSISEKEWREARYLYRTRGQRSSADAWSIMLIAVPLLGSVGDMVHSVRTTGFTARGSVVPLLLLLASLTAAVLVGLSRYRDWSAGQRSGITIGDWAAEVSETGFVRYRPDAGKDADCRISYEWSMFDGYRVGDHVIVFGLRDQGGFETLPLDVLSPEDQAWMQRMTARKIKSARPPASR